jgi:hypothetical protein
MAADPQQAARSAAMQDEMQAELQTLARKLLDLWQDHVSALAQDPTLMAQALKLMAAYAPFPWPGMSPTGGPGFAPNPFAGGQFPGFQFGGPGAAAPGPAPAAAAPDAGAGPVGELRRRLAELEGRLAELEGGRPAKPARKRAAKSRAGTPKGR